MAKLFYTLEEAAGKLKKSPEDVQKLVENGQLQEFRDRDKVMLKVDQVDLLAGGGGEDDVIPLAESGELGSISLASDSGSGMNLESPKEQTGISIFDADQTEEADPSAVTQITERAPSELSLETVGSGSGLMDLTREADDTSLGQDLLADVESPKEDGSTASETMAEDAGGGDAGALFESAPSEGELVGAGAAAGGGVAMVAAEPYDGLWSGLSGGVALGMVLVAAFAVALVVFGMTQLPGNMLITQIAGNLWMYVGIAAGVIFLPAIVGMLVAKKG